MTRSSTLGAAALLVAAVLAAVSIWLAGPPAPQPDTALETEFSAARAMRHVEAIAAVPHPIGSAENAAAREYILGALAEIGVAAEVEEGVGVAPGGAVAATVQNVVATIPGAAPGGRALMLACHYDSVPAAAGAGDDAAGVAAILETARALKTGPPLANDVVLLFTDGEEPGLLGADAFVASSPTARRVALAMNFEGRGAGGPVLLFETSEGNGRLVAAAVGHAPRPLGNSLAYTIYKLLPNDTDFTVFRAAGMRGLNFAFIDDVRAYHTSLDRPERLDRGSLEHHGSYALSLARHFGGADLDALGGEDVVFFNPVGSWMMRYPERWAGPLWVGVLVLFVVVAVAAVRGRIGVRSVAVTGAAVLVAGGAGWALVWLARLAHGSVLAPGRVDLEPFYGLVVALLAGAIVAAACSWLGRPGSSSVALAIALGGLSWFLALAAAASFALPGTSYLFVWPLVWALAGVGVAAVAERRGAPAAVGVLALVAGALPGVALLAPATRLVFASFGVSEIGAPVVAILTALTFLLVAPLFALVAEWRMWAAPGLLVGLAVAAVALGAVRAPYDDASPQPSNVVYALDADTGEAVWASYEARPSAWTTGFHSDAMRREPLPGFFPRRASQPALVSPAPATQLSGPVVELIGEAPSEGGRVLRLRAASTRGARAVTLSVTDVKVVAATANGREVAPSNKATGWTLTYLAPPVLGVEVELRVEGTDPVTVRAIDTTDGLPSAGAIAPRARPAATVPIQSGDQTLVARSFRF